MPTPSAKPTSEANQPFWYFIAESSVDDLIPAQETGQALMARLFPQAIRNLGIPAVCLNRIKVTLIEIVKQARAHRDQETSGSPIVVRLLVSNKMIVSGYSANVSGLLQIEQTTPPIQIIHSADKKINGGWGFFIVERALDFPTGSTLEPPIFIDLFLYQEGE